MISHGHFDHITGLDGLIRRLGRANFPVLLHRISGADAGWSSPDAIRSRSLRSAGGR
jgi:7,8-dihydropterin-6-yl-methyl-4-(beta-D-ribofuranosyl)aminobenzene 5'-phosphate synthase